MKSRGRRLLELLCLCVAIAILIALAVCLPRFQLGNKFDAHQSFTRSHRGFLTTEPKLDTAFNVVKMDPHVVADKLDTPFYFIKLDPYFEHFVDVQPIKSTTITMDGHLRISMHLTAWKQAISDHVDMAAFVETDASFELMPYWPASMRQMIQQAPADWTLLIMFSDYPYDTLSPAQKFHAVQAWEHQHFYFTHYILNSKGLANIMTLNPVVTAETDSVLRQLLLQPNQATTYLMNLPPLISPSKEPLKMQISERIMRAYVDERLKTAIHTVDLPLFNELAQPTLITDNQHAPTTLDIVVGHYSASLTWLDELLAQLPADSYRLFIYTKSTMTSLVMSTPIHQWIRLANIGRCDHAFVYHIVSTFGQPRSEKTFFVKDSATRHATVAELLALLQTPLTDQAIGPLQASSYYGVDELWRLLSWNENHDQNKNRDHFLTAPTFLTPFKSWSRVVLNDPYFEVETIHSRVHGAILLCRSENISTVPREVWIRIGLSLSTGANVETGHYLERFWCFLLSKPHLSN